MFIHTKYSIGYGVKAPEDIIDWAISHDFPFLVLSDINSTSAVISGLNYAQKKNFPLVIAVDIRNGLEHSYFLIAENNRGFYEINAFLTPFLQNGQDFPKKAPYFANCHVVYPFSNFPEKLQDNEWVGVRADEVNKVLFTERIAKEKLLAAPLMTFANKREYNTHRLLRAITENSLLSLLKKEQQAPISQRFYTWKEITEKYESAPFLLEKTQQLFATFQVHFGFGEEVVPQNLQTYTGTFSEDRQLIENLCLKGKKKRYSTVNFSTNNEESEKINLRIQQEIEVIEQKGYLSYFLITWDIIHYAKSKGYFHVGRGSGANSIVAYLLGITDVDPLDLDLYFERFINIHRKNPPDFDIDFSWSERDDVLNYVFQRFQNVALIATYNTFKYRSCIREIGKVLGLAKSEIDKLSRAKKDFSKLSLDKMSRLVLQYSQYIEGLPSHLSIHAGGVIITEKPVEWLSPTFLPPKGLPTVQFSMYEAEDVGLYKFDILSQRGLGKIHDCLHVIAYNQPKANVEDIHDIAKLKQDPKISHLLQTGEAIGCFYVESPAMRMLLKKLKTKNYLELVAASSIIRPGVASSGMMHEYIERHLHPEKRQSAHPLLAELMPETYGIMVYQEDVMKVAHFFADLSLDEADILRRAMSGKYRSRVEFTAIEQKFFSNCRKKGFDEVLIQTIWNQIKSFAGYAFSKGHSASYAVESFQSLYLKAHYPIEYMVSVINNGGGYYDTEFYFREAVRWGAILEAPCIHHSRWETVVKDKTIYIGFQHISGIDQREVLRLIRYRDENGLFHSFEEVLKGLFLSSETLMRLIRLGSFRVFNTNKQALKWQVLLFYKKTDKTSQSFSVKAPSLFEEEVKSYDLPVLDIHPMEQTFEELELLGFPLCNPFLLLKTPIPASKIIRGEDLATYNGHFITLYGYLITYKNVRTKTGEIMVFGTFQDIDGELFDTVHFPQIVKSQPLYGRGVYQLFGKVVNDFEYYSLEILQVTKLEETPIDQ